VEGRAKDAAVVFGGVRGLLCARGVLAIQIQRKRRLEVTDVAAREGFPILPVLWR
jgi:hypothetical protein